MKSLAVRVLGEFGVDGVEPQALGSRKARLALQHLALGGGQVVPTDVLVDALWEHDAPARPGDQLAVLMSRLRSVLGRERIEHRDGGYLLRADWLDATELAALTDEAQRRHDAGNVTGAAAAARVALSLLGGSEPAPVAGEWARLRRAELDRLSSRARRVAASALLEAGDWVGAADAATAALERDAYDEVALRVLLRRTCSAARWRPRCPFTPPRGSGSPTSWARTRRRRPPSCTSPSCAASSPRRPGRRPRRRRAWSAATTSCPTWTRSRCAPPAAALSRWPSSTENPASARRHWRAPGPAAGPPQATRCCWRLAGRSTGRCRSTRCSTRSPDCCEDSAARQPPTCWAATGSCSARCLAPRPARSSRCSPTACSAPRCCTRPWSGCCGDWANADRWPS